MGMSKLLQIRELEKEFLNYTTATEAACRAAYEESAHRKKMTTSDTIVLGDDKAGNDIHFRRLNSTDNPALRLFSSHNVSTMPPQLLANLLNRYLQDIPPAAIKPLITDPMLPAANRAISFIGNRKISARQAEIAQDGINIRVISRNTALDIEKQYGETTFDLLHNVGLSNPIRENDYARFRIQLDLFGHKTINLWFVKYLLDQSAYDIVLKMAVDGIAKFTIANAGCLRHCIQRYDKANPRLHALIAKINDIVPGIARTARYKDDTDLLWLLCEASLSGYRINPELYDLLVGLGCDPFRKNRFGLSSDDYRVGLRHWLTAEKKSQTQSSQSVSLLARCATPCRCPNHQG